MNDTPREMDSQPSPTLVPTTTPAGAKGKRSTRSIAAGTGRPYDYTDADCQAMWDRVVVGGESTLEVALDLRIDQSTVIKAIRYYAKIVDSAEEVAIERAKHIDNSRILRQTIQRRMNESVANVAVIDAMIKALVGTDRNGLLDPAKVINLDADQKKQYQSLLASRQFEVQSQLRISAELRAIGKDWAAFVGIAKPKPVKPKGEDSGDDKAVTDITDLVNRLDSMSDEELDELS